MEPRRLTVELAGPLDLEATFAPLGRWGDDGLDRWDGRTLVRTLSVAGAGRLAYAAHPAGSVEEPRLTVDLEREHDPELVRAAIRRTITTSEAANAALGTLAAQDPAVRALADAYPGVRPVLFRDPLTALVRSISAQQVNLRWAAEIRRRLALRYGRRHAVGGEVVYSLSARPLAEATVAELRQLQLTTSKAKAVIACAHQAAAGSLELADLDGQPDEIVIERLTAIPGIGRWSAEWFLARTLGRARVVCGDLGVRKAVGRMYDTPHLPSEADVRALTAHWVGAASLVQSLALHDLAINPIPAIRRATAPLRAG